MLRVPLALVAAPAARLNACLNDHCGEPRVEFDLPRKHIPRSCAHVGAIEVQANAADECLDVLLCEACVRTGRAGLRAVVTGLDTSAENNSIDGGLSSPRLDHLLRVSHGASLLTAW